MKRAKINRDRAWFSKKGRHGLENRVADISQSLSQIDTSTLSAADIGAAEGEISKWLSGMFKTVTAIEFLPNLANALNDTAMSIPNLTSIEGDFMEWNSQMKFDVTFFLGVMHYFLGDESHAATLSKVIDFTDHMLILRTGIREFRVARGYHITKRGKDISEKYLSLHTLRPYLADWDISILDNTYRGQGDQRLGDLAIFRRRNDQNPLPPILTMFGGTENMMDFCDI